MPIKYCGKYGAQLPGRTTFCCEMCGFETFSGTAFKLHVKHVHKAVVGLYVCVCGKCSKSFGSQKELNSHMKIHQKHVRQNKMI